MKRNDLLRLLADHQTDIRRLGATSLALFGSIARDEAREDSDVDILVEFEVPPSFSAYMDLKFYLEDLIGCNVDLVPKRTLKPRIRPYVEREAIYVP